MKDQDFITSFSVDQTPEEVFKAIKNVRGWWSEEIEGAADKLGAEFTYHYEDVHLCKVKITEFIPGKKVAWLVLDNYFDSPKTKLSGRGQKSFSKSLSKTAKRNSVSHTRV